MTRLFECRPWLVSLNCNTLQWGPVIEEVVVELLDSLVRYGEWTDPVNLHTYKTGWLEKAFIGRVAKGILYGVNGQPLYYSSDEEYWEALQFPEMVIDRYSSYAKEILQEIISNNALTLNNLMHFHGTSFTFIGKTSSFLFFKLTGASNGYSTL